MSTVCLSTGSGFNCSSWNGPTVNTQNILAGDFSGDGVTDLLGHVSDTQWRMSRSAMASTDGLTQVSNGVGDVNTITYTVLTDSSVYTPNTGATYPLTEVTAPVQVVASVVGSNGVGGTLATTYKYGGLRTNFEERAALGFAWMESRQTQTGARVRTDYRQDGLYVGLPARVRKWSNTSLLSDSTFAYDCNAMGTTHCQASLIAAFAFPYQSSRIDKSWDLDGSILPQITTQTEYDGYGNATYVETLTSDGHRKVTRNTYTNDAYNWKLGRLTHAEVTSSAPGVPSQTRTAAFTYANGTGLLDKEVVEPNDATLCLVTQYAHDAYGNRTTSTVRNCNGSALEGAAEAPAPTGNPAFVSRTSSVQYDARGQFPIASTNALGHAETRTFDPATGNPLTLTGPNGLTTRWQYDALGRKTQEIRADGNRTRWTYSYCSGVNGGFAACPQHAQYLIEESPRSSNDTPNAPWVRSYYDLADRGIAVRTLGFDGSSEIWQQTEYDSLGRVARTSRPHFSAESPWWTRYEYDAIGRTTAVIQPNNTWTQTHYNGLTTRVTNALNQTEARTVNSQGQLISVQDAAYNTLTYKYDAQGNLLGTTNPNGNVTVLQYDLRGRKTQMTDPDMGVWKYTYNALGELIRQTDAKNQVTTLQYDRLGRMTQRVEPGLTSSWHYDTYKGGALGAQTACGKSIGKLCRAESSDSSYKRTYQYDDLGRPTQTQIAIAQVNYDTTLTYDAQGRVQSMEYPKPALALLPFAINYVYTELGYLKEIRDRTGNTVYWRAEQMDAEGRLKLQSYGNGHSKQHTYSPLTGYLTDIETQGGSIQSLSYEYDAIGNMTSRSDSRSLLTETFQYDILNRLKTATVNAPGITPITTSYDYDALGNMTGRSDLGSYVYNTGATAVRPHAVRQIELIMGGIRQYSYDANGNLTQDTGSADVIASRSITWTGYNQPERIQSGNTKLDFNYGPEHQRIQQKNTSGLLGALTTTYVHPDNAGGLHFEKDTQGLKTEHRYYIVAAGQLVAIAKRKSSVAGVLHGTVTLTYLHQDHLGSTTVVGDSEQLSYEPFGKRRFTNGKLDLFNSLAADATNRGFTGHEHLDDVGLIHMNGRIYDPRTARFMSPDPIIQAAANLQSYNRYSYALNNPLSYIDPSGYSLWGKIVNSVSNELRRWESDFRHEMRRPGSLLAPVLRVAGATASVLGCAGAASAACYAGIEGAISRSQGITGSNLIRNTAIAGATAYGFGYVGGKYAAGSFQSYAGHALVGCGSAMAGGGNCGQGAAAAVVGHAASAASARVHESIQLAFAATAGGASSVITGGKFSNGAVTGAFGYLFSTGAHKAIEKQLDQYGRPLTDSERAIYANHFSEDILNVAIIFDGKVPFWLRSSMDGLTLGNKIYFREGVYLPGTAGGVEILGHELHHVEQYFNGMTYGKYIWASLGGYWKNPYEISAYAKADRIRASFCFGNPQAPGC
ncbi:RHS repeat-associated core domain-containing protein [Sinimarinibacterium sp. NLF-5-8]|uniref:RHS repeat-associated core domain-containing protein n=1 Tax=Sinimarinibacterium sp. NLF-5-8 TaxID=2698684 RepID=UPI00137BAE9E|nr:RHS repeat-associated core domain-containing protein [Sinimarinibacterium sp. NLF-5-8]QHS11192.1 DUF4157 domain-containing protein [Sinimarinibacterium sp. NLF-5-8]